MFETAGKTTFQSKLLYSHHNNILAFSDSIMGGRNLCYGDVCVCGCMISNIECKVPTVFGQGSPEVQL